MTIFTLKQLIVYGFNRAESLADKDNERARRLFNHISEMYEDNFRKKEDKDDEIDVLIDEVYLSVCNGFWEAR